MGKWVSAGEILLAEAEINGAYWGHEFQVSLGSCFFIV